MISLNLFLKVRVLLREQCLSPTPEYTEGIRENLKIFDRLFAEFEYSYVQCMVHVKSPREYELHQDLIVLFSDTLQRALKNEMVTQDVSIEKCFQWGKHPSESDCSFADGGPLRAVAHVCRPEAGHRIRTSHQSLGTPQRGQEQLRDDVGSKRFQNNYSIYNVGEI